MLTACAASRENPVRSPDPVVETRTVTRTVCPAELTAPVPAPVPSPFGLVIEASADALKWIGDHLAREQLLERRLTDGAAQCPR